MKFALPVKHFLIFSFVVGSQVLLITQGDASSTREKQLAPYIDELKIEIGKSACPDNHEVVTQSFAHRIWREVADDIDDISKRTLYGRETKTYIRKTILTLRSDLPALCTYFKENYIPPSIEPEPEKNWIIEEVEREERQKQRWESYKKGWKKSSSSALH